MKFVYVLIALSVGVIVFGLYLIVQEPQSVEPTPSAREIGLLPIPSPTSDSDLPQVDAEPGTEPWCDMMLHKPGDNWGEDETRTFADNCIYQNE